MVDHNLSAITQQNSSSDTTENWNDGQGSSVRDLASVSTEFRRLLSGLETILTEAARRIEAAPGDWLPGLSEVVEGTILYTTPTNRPVNGWYCAGAWHDKRSGQRFAEIVLNAGTLDRPAELVLGTLVHELVHAYADAMDLNDTSRRGDYHNAVFADLAMKAGLLVQPHPTRGHITTGISPLGVQTYGHLIDALTELLRLHRDRGPDRDPEPGGAAILAGVPTEPEDDEPQRSKYVLAQCGCTNTRGRPVIIRVARGSWTADSIWCRRCDWSFAEAPGGLSESPQHRAA